MRVRAPAVAGSFYPADPKELRELVAHTLAGATPPAEDEPAARALIAPHAGYVYSGGVAAVAWLRAARLADRIRRVVLLGPAHRAFLRGLAAPRADAFSTPLGVVPIDRASIDALIDLPQLSASDAPHAGEHCLEVQLPFLQCVLPAVPIVPLVVGDAGDDEVQEVIERLWEDAGTLTVISSDLSHYHDYATARRMDAASCRAIEALDPARLGPESACGRVPVRGLLCAARALGLTARTLDLRNSGDTAGGRERVVGYGAWAFHPAPG